MEPAEQANKKQPTIFANSEWAKNAEFCSCDNGNLVERVLYICLHPACPNHTIQKFYCQACLEGGKHEHFPLNTIKSKFNVVS